MFESGRSNPSNEAKRFILEVVEKLSKMPLDESISVNDGSLLDAQGNVIARLDRNLIEKDSRG